MKHLRNVVVEVPNLNRLELILKRTQGQRLKNVQTVKKCCRCKFSTYAYIDIFPELHLHPKSRYSFTNCHDGKFFVDLSYLKVVNYLAFSHFILFRCFDLPTSLNGDTEAINLWSETGISALNKTKQRGFCTELTLLLRSGQCC